MACFRRRGQQQCWRSLGLFAEALVPFFLAALHRHGNGHLSGDTPWSAHWSASSSRALVSRHAEIGKCNRRSQHRAIADADERRQESIHLLKIVNHNRLGRPLCQSRKASAAVGSLMAHPARDAPVMAGGLP